MIALVVRLGRAVLGATLNRWRGGWIFSAPRFVRLTAMGTAVGTVVYLDHQHLAYPASRAGTTPIILPS